MNKDNKRKLPLVVIFGRTNAGKSTLFNCLTESNQALTADIEGTTRDSNIAVVSWGYDSFRLIDTGGIIDTGILEDGDSREFVSPIDDEVQRQARDYLGKAALILFLVDVKSGILPQDRVMARFLKTTIKKGQKVILVANKSDGPRDRGQSAEFFSLGLGEPLPVSAATGSGTGDLLDMIVESLGKTGKPADSLPEEGENDCINVAIVGKPNVGKSSLLNAILGEKRVIVSPLAHTTREPQHTELDYKDSLIRLVDTAGMSRQGIKANVRKSKNTGLEKLGIAKSLNSLEKADITLFVMDINDVLTHQDSKIIDEMVKRKNSVIIVANKWDMVEEKDTKKYTEYIYSNLPFIQWAPIQFISAKTGEKVNKILDLVIEIKKQRDLMIDDKELEKFLKRIVKIHKPAKGKGLKHPHIHRMIQTQADPPKFSLSIRANDNLHFSYVRFIENQLRKNYGFLGTPLTIYVSRGKRAHGEREKTDSLSAERHQPEPDEDFEREIGE